MFSKKAYFGAPFSVNNIPQYETDALAVIGGLVAGDLYQRSDGTLAAVLGNSAPPPGPM